MFAKFVGCVIGPGEAIRIRAISGQVDYEGELASDGTTLEPGDVIATGTPPGVGMARSPQRFLAAGDEVEVEVAGIGTLRNPVVAG